VDSNRKACQQRVHGHPCFGESGAYHHSGRIHLPVAPRCNIKCKYCLRKHDCANENRPGLTSRVIKPEEAVNRVREVLANEPRIRVAAVAGPGDALANPASFETLRLVHQEFPHLIKCMSTNGLLLLDSLDSLLKAGVNHLTITINAVYKNIGKQIYSWVRYKEQTLFGEDAFEVLSARQIEGLRAAVREGITVKVNSVLIPGINDEHLVKVAQVVAEEGAHVMNIMKLIPQAEFSLWPAPSNFELSKVQHQCELFIRQFRGCRQCRADAVGFL
jgi:nitrogen fixation protein NifB